MRENRFSRAEPRFLRLSHGTRTLSHSPIPQTRHHLSRHWEPTRSGLLCVGLAPPMQARPLRRPPLRRHPLWGLRAAARRARSSPHGRAALVPAIRRPADVADPGNVHVHVLAQPRKKSGIQTRTNTWDRTHTYTQARDPTQSGRPDRRRTPDRHQVEPHGGT